MNFILQLSLFLYFPLEVSYFHVFLFRRKVQVDEIFVHENYTAGGSKENDIALLRLGEKTFCCQSTLGLGETSKHKILFLSLFF